MAKRNHQIFNHLASAPKLSLEQFKMSEHAQQRALGMAGVTGEMIRKVVEHPTHAYFSLRNSIWIYSRGKISLPIAINADGTQVATTVLWAASKDWAQDAATAPMDRGDGSRRSKNLARSKHHRRAA